jgi:trk system potassium uptake protein TrkH
MKKGPPVSAKPVNQATSRAASAIPAASAASPAAPTLAGWLFPMYVAMIFIGYAALKTQGAMITGQQMGIVRALFTSVNAATLTGFQQTFQIDAVCRPLGQGVIFAMILGGSICTLVISGTAMSRILRLHHSDREILRAVLIAEAIAVGGGAFFLLFDKDRTVWQAIFIATSAFANGGLYIGAQPNALAWQTHLILLPLITAGGLGICVLMELFDRLRGKTDELSPHANAVLGLTAWLYIGGTIVLVLLNSYDWTQWRELALTSGAAAVGSRTAGLGLVEPGKMVRAAPWAVMLLMLIGACSGGTGGGVKCNTILVIFKGVRAALRGHKVPRAFGIAACWVGMYAALVLLTLFALLRGMEQTAPDRLIFLSISAASNVGLSFDPLSPDPLPAFVLCGTMIVGRFAPLMFIWWMADTTRDAEMAAG